MYKLKFLFVAILLSGCHTASVGSQDSGIETPSSWNQLTSNQRKTINLNTPIAISTEAKIDQSWWKNFNDPILNSLIDEALKNNKTLQIAKSRIQEAKAGRTLAQSSLFPQINGVANVNRQNLGFMTGEKTMNIAEANLQASWELDLFGRNQLRTAQATAILESTEASQQAVRVGLLSEVARTYFDIHNYKNQILVTKKNLKLQQKTLALIKAQQEGGLVSDFDVQRAAAQASMTEAQIPPLQMAYEATLNRMNVLLGYTPNHKDLVLKKPIMLKPLNSNILIAAPAKILESRPDIRVAERQFAASISATKAAKASVLPNISLMGLFGLQESSSFSSIPWNIGAGVVQPILNFGSLEAQIDSANARQKQAFLNYQQTVLLALENMENALSSYLHETAHNASLTKGVEQNRKATMLAKQQYENGYTGLLDVLIAERNVLDAESAVITSEIALRKNLINIYAAAGGGWQANQ
jgi:multidrug efflux system outer membrane protein